MEKNSKLLVDIKTESASIVKSNHTPDYKIEVLEKLCKEIQTVKSRQKEINLKAEIISFITSITVKEDNLVIIYACAKYLLQIISNKHIFQLSNTERNQLLDWLQIIFNAKITLDVSLVTATTTILQVYDYCDAKLLWNNIIVDNNLLNRASNNLNVNGCPNGLLLAVVQCYDAVLYGFLKNEQEANYEDLNANKEITKIILEIYYNFHPICNDCTYGDIFALHAVRLLTKLCTLSATTAHMFTSELLGLSRLLWFYGLNESTISVKVLQKILPSQQAVALDETEAAAAVAAAKGELAKNHGGRLTKTRKLKTVERGTTTSKNIQDGEKELMQFLDELKTSDSELSDKESSSTNVQFLLKKRQRLCAKVILIC